MNPIVWDASPTIVDFVLFGHLFELRWYSMMFITGFTAGYFIGRSFLRREGEEESDLGTYINYTVIGTIVGARLGHVIFYQPDYYLKHPLEVVMIWEGGLASHGGFLGVVIAIWLYLKKNKAWGFLWLCDRTTIPTLLVAALIRLGNLFNSEIIGGPSDLPWSMVFSEVDSIPRHPTQLYECALYFSCFLLTYALYWFSNIRFYRGRLLGLGFVVSFLGRLLIEFVKEDQVPFERGMILNMGQILSLPFIFCGLWLLLRKTAPIFTEPQSAIDSQRP